MFTETNNFRFLRGDNVSKIVCTFVTLTFFKNVRKKVRLDKMTFSLTRTLRVPLYSEKNECILFYQYKTCLFVVKEEHTFILQVSLQTSIPFKITM